MLLRFIVYLIVAFLLIPLALIVLFSFNADQSFTFPINGYSFRWYEQIFTDPQLTRALWKSLMIATLTAIVTLVLGAAASLAWLRFGKTGRGILEVLCITPIALPGLFLGVSLLVLASQVGVQLSMVTIVVSHVVLALPMLMIAMRARLALFDPSLEEASRDLGASQILTFRRVTLPLIAPTLISCAVLSFALSFDEFVVTAFVSGTETTLPMYIWSMMRRTVTPLINAISTLAMIFTIAIITIALVISAMKRAANLSGREAA
ncbi:ABC transporter permease [Brucella sp. NBRC 113783]|uniref:ABC transporter permease n=1 Tax=Brucella sp. NBRC 113783 TaxID=3075478 RepID=UPI0029BFF369|nr:ABC transporter permease [Brucella sp. NBRC 113783]MDX4075584.1 ABC transporter permease [Brucella sp. NBRC 113783]